MKLSAYVKLIQPPIQLAARPQNRQGLPLPWFILEEYDNFKKIKTGAVDIAHQTNVCWLCGSPLLGLKAFVCEPIQAITRVTAEPTSHADCAEFVAKMPYTTQYNSITLVWLVRTYRHVYGPKGSTFELPNPVETLWFKKGQVATRGEVLEALHKDLPFLELTARLAGPEAEDTLRANTNRAMQYLPRPISIED